MVSFRCSALGTLRAGQKVRSGFHGTLRPGGPLRRDRKHRGPNIRYLAAEHATEHALCFHCARRAVLYLLFCRFLFRQPEARSATLPANRDAGRPIVTSGSVAQRLQTRTGTVRSVSKCGLGITSAKRLHPPVKERRSVWLRTAARRHIAPPLLRTRQPPCQRP
jgi:hypothetical protein